MQLAAALPLGFTSECEIADIWMLEPLNPKIALAKMKPKMAPGVEVQQVTVVDLKEPPLQTLTCEATYQAVFIDSLDFSVLKKRVTSLMDREEIWRQRRGKEYDLRPLILKLSAEKRVDGSPALKMGLSLLPGKTGRPDEVIAALDLDPLSARIHRTRIVLANEANQNDEN
jgi:radical SAM-linked protein